ncbi:MAG: transposase family protein [Candidatus Acidiferrales bacterium]
MEKAATECEALDEAIVRLDYFKDLPDRRQQGKVTYPLDEILLLCLLAVLAGAETFIDMARAGQDEAELAAPVSAVSLRHALA